MPAKNESWHFLSDLTPGNLIYRKAKGDNFAGATNFVSSLLIHIFIASLEDLNPDIVWQKPTSQLFRRKE